MCYSAIVKQDLKQLGLQYHARVDIPSLEAIFKKRSNGEKINIPRGLEFNFKNPKTLAGKNILNVIKEFRLRQIQQLESDLAFQITRLHKATRDLEDKGTKKAEQEKAVASRQIERIRKRLEALKNERPSENDSRIYAFDWAPVIIQRDHEHIIVPMRYHLRPPGMSESFDRKYPGCYNARFDSLTGFWKNEFGKKHGILVISSFFENVKLHNLEKRKLGVREVVERVVLQYKPHGLDHMVVPCLWDHWGGPGEKGFDSFAIITDEPPPEVLETGHDRCPIFLNEERIEEWLNPQGKSTAELLALLGDRQRAYYEHKLAA
ncbi:MAG: SOS response-associated peptidase family protein [Pseudobdellovibrionaceae bacterium]